jgi:hypothetical protein
MEIKITDLHQEITYYTVPNGTYKGRHSGHEIRFDTPIGEFVGKCDSGVRGMNIPCTITVKDGTYEINYIGNGKI